MFGREENVSACPRSVTDCSLFVCVDLYKHSFTLECLIFPIVHCLESFDRYLLTYSGSNYSFPIDNSGKFCTSYMEFICVCVQPIEWLSSWGYLLNIHHEFIQCIYCTLFPFQNQINHFQHTCSVLFKFLQLFFSFCSKKANQMSVVIGSIIHFFQVSPYKQECKNLSV